MPDDIRGNTSRSMTCHEMKRHVPVFLVLVFDNLVVVLAAATEAIV